jgi:hypothetical protein
MPIIQAGLSANVYIPVGQILTVKCLGSATSTLTVRNSSGGAVQLDIASSALNGSYGPYGQDTAADMDATGGQVDYSVGTASAQGALNSAQLASVSARSSILSGASAGADSGWLLIGPHAERLLYQLDTGTTTTGFTVDISIDGVTSLGQAWTGTYNSSTVAEFSPPMWFTNPLAKYFRVTVTSGGPISFARCA